MATIGQRIEELIGSAYSTIPTNSKSDLINAAISEVADMLPADLLMKYLNDSNVADIGVDGAYTTVEGKKVLLVTREINDSATSPTAEAVAVPIQEFYQCQDSDSMYEATAYSPVYSYKASGGTGSDLVIYPIPTGNQAGKVHYFAYPTSDQSGNNTITGLPSEVTQAIVVKASVNILQTYISDFVQDEEDTELQQMLTAQMQLLQTNFANEMKRFMEQDATPRGE